MSTLKVDNIRDNGSGFNDVVSFQNANGTENGRLCRAFVNFNGTSAVAIRANFNVNSITDNGTGDYTANFANALTDTNYVPVVGGDFSQGATRDNGIHIPSNFDFATGSLRTSTTPSNGALTDIDTVLIVIFR